MRLQSVVLIASLSLTVFVVHAEPAAPSDALRKISVTATRGPREIDDIAGNVTVKTAGEITAEMSTDIKDLMRYEPGISVANAATRFGLAGFNIRGIEGNRVLMRVDGIRVSDAFSIGSFSSARRNLIDLDAVKPVEIIRGPASALYGSDAIGGVVSFVMKDPLDYLDAGRSSFVSARSGYQSDDHGWFAGSTLALGSETVSGLLNYTHRDGEEIENQGDVASLDQTRTRPNPQSYDSDSVLAKVLWSPSSNQTLRLTADVERDTTKTNVLSGVGVVGTVNTQRQSGDDDQSRTRISLSHEITFDTAVFDTPEWQPGDRRRHVEHCTGQFSGPRFSENGNPATRGVCAG